MPASAPAGTGSTSLRFVRLPVAGGGLEAGIVRAGAMSHQVQLSDPRPEACRDACQKDARCRAFVFVRPGVPENRGALPLCQLKDSAGAPVRNGCCTSGVK